MKKGNLITKLEAYLSNNPGIEKKQLIKEGENKSIMDPEILIDE